MNIKNTSFKLAGLKLGYKTTNKDNKAMEDCGALWQHFGGSFLGTKLPQKLSNDIYAVYFDYDGDHTDPYAYFIGYRVPDDAVIPDGIDTITIPTQDYEQLSAKGRMPNCVADTWREIWKRIISTGLMAMTLRFTDLKAVTGAMQKLISIYL